MLRELEELGRINSNMYVNTFFQIILQVDSEHNSLGSRLQIVCVDKLFYWYYVCVFSPFKFAKKNVKF